ncbi:hypothetical protein SEA_JORGENSEN_64 [Mycobacterium phage Jorgensen]|nr:hypothetical protein SEA_JORGENSEN_64 [Mycobacterium phage Jorgensen]
MNPELRAVLTEALAGHQPANYGFNCSGCDWEPANPGVTDAAEFAAHQLDVLDAVPGVAVIQLPEPEVWDGPGKERYWRIGDTTVTVDKWNMLSVTLNDDWIDDETPPSAADFRDLAAALLAAAAVVAEGEA